MRSISATLRMKGLMGYADGSIRPPSKSWSLQSQGTATPETPTPTSTSNPFDLPSDSQQALVQSTGAAYGITSDEGPLPHLPIMSTVQEEEWSRLDAAAAAHITLNIKSQVIRMKFQGGAPAVEIWSSLCARFEGMNGVLALLARNRLNGCKYTDGHDLQSHLDDMTMLWENTLTAGAKIQEFCHILRSSFPPSWAPLVATLFTLDDPIVLESSLLAFADMWGQRLTPGSPTVSTIPVPSFSGCTNCGKGNYPFYTCYRKGEGVEHPAAYWWRTKHQVQRFQGPPRAKAAPVDTNTPSSNPLDSSTHNIITPSITTSATARSRSPYNPFRRQRQPTNPFRRISSDPSASID